MSLIIGIAMLVASMPFGVLFCLMMIALTILVVYVECHSTHHTNDPY